MSPEKLLLGLAAVVLVVVGFGPATLGSSRKVVIAGLLYIVGGGVVFWQSF